MVRGSVKQASTTYLYLSLLDEEKDPVLPCFDVGAEDLRAEFGRFAVEVCAWSG